MGVMLEAFYRLGTGGVPSPADGDRKLPWWWDHLAAQAHALRESGFTAVWLPPPLKGASGTLSVGYDVFDDYDLGAKQQKGAVATRYGTRAQLARCVATMRACGLDVMLDLVENQRSGGDNFHYRYRDAQGGDGGRFPKDPDCFHPNVPQDPGVFGGPRATEMSFGDDLAVINGRPKDYVAHGLIQAAGWMTRALNVQGFRVDDVKGVSTRFVPRLLDARDLAGKFAVGEFFDGDVGAVRQWLWETGRRAALFDFPLRFVLGRMCDQSWAFDMGGSLDHAGLAGVEPLSAVTFIENHDTDARAELCVVNGKMLAYAYLLTSEGYPCVFYRDYSTDPGCYGMKPLIDNLIWIHEKLADGPTVERWKEVGLFAFERLGGPHLLVGLNKDDWQGRTITVDTGFGANVKLHDYTGHAGDTWTDGAGRATVWIPPNHQGRGYACYSRDGIGLGFEVRSHAVTQEIEGAPDLDVGPASTAAASVAGRIWVERAKPITVALEHLEAAGTPSGTLAVGVRDPDGHVLTTVQFPRAGAPPLRATAVRRGWHSITVQAHGLPPGKNALAFTLAVTYTAPLRTPEAELAANP